MLIYSKKRTDGKTRLFGTESNVPNFSPTAEGGDYELVYKDMDGDLVNITDADLYVDNTVSGIQQVRRLSDEKQLTVYIKKVTSGVESLIKVIGKDPVIPKVVTSIKITQQATTKTFVVGSTFDRTGLKVAKVYGDGDSIVAEDAEISTNYDAHVFTTADIGASKVITITCAGKTTKYNIAVTAE